MRPLSIGFALAALLGGCGQSEPRTPAAPHAAQRADTVVADSSAQYRLRKDNAAPEVMPHVDAPKNFAGLKHPEPPAYLPLYPGAKIHSSFARPRPGGTGGGTIIFETEASPADVIAFYRKTEAESGFSETTESENDGTLAFGAGAGRRTIQIIAQPIATGSHVQIFWTGGE